MKENILIIEDTLPMQRVLVQYLEEQYDSFCCASGQEALAILPNMNCKAVLLDLGLPDIDGLDLIPKLYEIQPKIEIIIVTGHDARDKIQKAENLGIRDFIMKPPVKDRILFSVKNAIHHYDVSRKLENYKDLTSVAASHNPEAGSRFLSDKVIPLHELESLAIHHAIMVMRGNKRKAAKALGISLATLYRKLS